ncbi:hypothetical protein F5888DRAFT_1724649 [Russula emetica]|nr:hypothetical protein F5888DRAFT_1724649 [Russula emetica]
MLSQSEGHQEHPRIITVEASVDSRGTAQDVLQTIHEDFRIPFPGRELSELGVEERAGINATFGETCKSEEDLSKGPRRIDLGSRDKIQILLKFAPDGSELTPTSTLPIHALHSGRIFELDTLKETKDFLGAVGDRNDEPSEWMAATGSPDHDDRASTLWSAGHVETVL